MSDRERFQILFHAFDVTRALELVDTTKITEVPIETLRGWFPMIWIDEEHARKSDPDKPGLMAWIKDDENGKVPMLIDGWHRAYKAHLKGRDHFCAHLLTVEQSNACLLSGTAIEEEA
jgi:hypothetical protein